jgi:hypothetical protein
MNTIAIGMLDLSWGEISGLCFLLISIVFTALSYWHRTMAIKEKRHQAQHQANLEQQRSAEEENIQLVIDNCVDLPIEQASAILSSAGICYKDEDFFSFYVPEAFWTCKARNAFKAMTIMTLIKNHIRNAGSPRPIQLMVDDLLELFQSNLTQYPGKVIAVICELASMAKDDNTYVIKDLLLAVESLKP